jgi:hypothetical protein
LSESLMPHHLMLDSRKGLGIKLTRMIHPILHWVVITILKGDTFNYFITVICFHLNIYSLCSTPFAPPWKGRSGTGLRVRGGRAGPGHTRFHSFLVVYAELMFLKLMQF